MKKAKWAIWGTGSICHEFAEGMEHVGNGELCCVLSRTQEKAEAFAKEFNIPKAYSNADQMLKEGGADIVYIGTPNRVHYENMQACIRHKKHILCEKPLVINSQEMEKVLQEARAAGVFLMEGMWTLFFPVIHKVQEWLRGGKIGRPIRANMNFSVKVPSDGWRLGKDMAGGALLDLGIYCLTMTDLVFGLDPVDIQSVGIVKNGVDVGNSVILKYSEDQLSTFTTALDCLSDNKAIIQGETGFIEIKRKFWCPVAAELFANEATPSVASSVELFEDPYPSSGFQYEATHVGELILQGAKEPSVVTHEKSRKLIRLMDKLRTEWGLDIS